MVLIYILLIVIVVDFIIWIFNVFNNKDKKIDSITLQNMFFEKFIFTMPLIPILIISNTLENKSILYIELIYLILNGIIAIIFKIKRLFKRVK